MAPDERNKFRRVDKQQRKYYFAPDVIELIEAEHARTGYPRNVILELLVREKFARPVEEAVAIAPSQPKPLKRKRAEIDLGL